VPHQARRFATRLGRRDGRAADDDRGGPRRRDGPARAGLERGVVVRRGPAAAAAARGGRRRGRERGGDEIEIAGSGRGRRFRDARARRRRRGRRRDADVARGPAVRDRGGDPGGRLRRARRRRRGAARGDRASSTADRASVARRGVVRERERVVETPPWETLERVVAPEERDAPGERPEVLASDVRPDPSRRRRRRRHRAFARRTTTRFVRRRRLDSTIRSFDPIPFARF